MKSGTDCEKRSIRAPVVELVASYRTEWAIMESHFDHRSMLNTLPMP